MGKKDITLKTYFSDKRRFADLINGTLLNGRQVLCANKLTSYSPVHNKADNDSIMERISDLAMFQIGKESNIAVYFI